MTTIIFSGNIKPQLERDQKNHTAGLLGQRESDFYAYCNVEFVVLDRKIIRGEHTQHHGI